MARVRLDSNLKNADAADLRTPIETIFQQLEDQLSETPNIAVVTDDEPALPKNIQRKDIVFKLSAGVLSIGVYNGKEVVYLL